MNRTERFALAPACTDGRPHDPLRNRAHHRPDLEVTDPVTVQAPDNVPTNDDNTWMGRLAERARMSQQAHNNTQLILASHSDRAGHPVSEAEHHHDVEQESARRTEPA